MNIVSTTTFPVSAVEPAGRPLFDVPSPHAVAGLLGARRANRQVSLVDQEIAILEQVLPRLRQEVDEPLPSWMEDNRRGGYPEEADEEMARRQGRVRDAEHELAVLSQRRTNLLAEAAARLRTPPREIEACSRYHGRLVADVVFHPLVAALHLAFRDHRPVCLSPDMIWLLIAQGVANHVNANAEELRPRFVRHQGKARLVVRRDDFVKGSPENPWPEVFPAFTEQVRGHVGDVTHDFFVANFSTTGPAEKAAFEIVLLDAVQSYFTFELHTVCGIPAVTLEGSADDWRAVLEQARQLPRFDLAGWLTVLEPTLQQFVAAAEGRPDSAFWQSIYKHRTVSGGDVVTGWIVTFFPYLKDPTTKLPTEPNRWAPRTGKEPSGEVFPATGERGGFGSGPSLQAFPAGLARAPLLWQYLGQEFEMEFLGGFVGVAQDAQTLCLRPEIGWAVCESAASSREPPGRSRA
jgi:Domain of unknown function (DUF4419)